MTSSENSTDPNPCLKLTEVASIIIEKAKLDLSDDVRTVELKNWLNYLKN